MNEKKDLMRTAASMIILQGMPGRVLVTADKKQFAAFSKEMEYCVPIILRLLAERGLVGLDEDLGNAGLEKAMKHIHKLTIIQAALAPKYYFTRAICSGYKSASDEDYRVYVNLYEKIFSIYCTYSPWKGPSDLEQIVSEAFPDYHDFMGKYFDKAYKRAKKVMS